MREQDIFDWAKSLATYMAKHPSERPVEDRIRVFADATFLTEEEVDRLIEHVQNLYPDN